mmetsp:Transcript_879/g.2003  ORF Transcript_879/g.2003 Transcript_879/m.2003 type:complete len:250 (-) Transcript_879:263-1012(-)
MMMGKGMMDGKGMMGGMMGGKGMMGGMKGGKGGTTGESKACQGIVKSYNQAKGFGFITSSACDGDIYFKFQGALEAGQPVSFKLNMSTWGSPQAADVTLSLAEGEMTSGTIKSFSAENGWGFVTVPGQPDIYFKKQDLPAELQSIDESSMPGQRVHFSIHITQDGKMQMRSASISGKAQGIKRPLAASTMGCGGGKQGSPGKGGGAWGQAQAPWSPAQAQATKRFKGGDGGFTTPGLVKPQNKGYGWFK